MMNSTSGRSLQEESYNHKREDRNNLHVVEIKHPVLLRRVHHWPSPKQRSTSKYDIVLAVILIEPYRIVACSFQYFSLSNIAKTLQKIFFLKTFYLNVMSFDDGEEVH
jgi:hypothetical protein